MKFALFLTQGTSLKLWDEKGWLHGGAPIQSYNRWADFFDTLYFVTYGGKEDLRYGDFLNKKIVVLPKPNWLKGLKGLKLPTLIYSVLSPWIHRRVLKNVDIFYSAQMQGAWSAAIAKYLFKKKFILHCGYLWSTGELGRWPWLKRKILPLIESAVYRSSDFIIMTSEHAKQYIQDHYGIDPRKIDVTRNPVDTDLFKPLSIKQKPKSLIYVGRLEKEKNPWAVFKALVGLKVPLTVVGRGSLEKSLKEYAVRNGLSVDFKGNIPNNDLPDLLNQHSLYIMPSFYEGSPKALLEAMSCGMAVIGTNVQGIDEILIHRENGYLCEPSPESIRDAVITLSEDPLLARKLGKNARKYILKNCDLNQKIEKELKIYKRVYSR